MHSPIIKKGDYDYFVHPITDGIPYVDPTLLDEVISAIMEIGDMNCEKIVAAEAMAIPLSAAVSVRINRPYVVIRKRRYGLPGEVSVEAITGYSNAQMFVNGVYEGDRVLIVDDVLSTGGTLRAIVAALRIIGVDIVDTIIVFNKMEDKSRLEKELNLTIKTLLDVRIAGGKMKII